MKFRRLITLVFCFIMILNIALLHAAANGRDRFKQFRGQGLTGGYVTIKVEETMLEGDCFVAEGWMFTEEQWIGFFVRNLLVGRDAGRITKVVLRQSLPRHMRHKLLLPCPPVLSSMARFHSTVSKSGDQLIVICPSLSSTVCDKWYLNETGLILFGR